MKGTFYGPTRYRKLRHPLRETVPSTYWRWVGLGIDVTTFTATVTLHAYLSEQAFADKRQPVGTRQVTLTGQEFGAMAAQIETPGNTGLSQVIYAHAKTLDGFTAATDV